MSMSPKAYAEAILSDSRVTEFILRNPQYKEIIDQSMKNLHANKIRDFEANQGVMELKGYKINPIHADKVNAFLNSERIPFEQIAESKLAGNYYMLRELKNLYPEIFEEEKPKDKVIPRFFEPDVMKFMAHSMEVRSTSVEKKCAYWDKAYEFYDDYYDHDTALVELTLSNSFMGLFDQYQQLCGE